MYVPHFRGTNKKKRDPHKRFRGTLGVKKGGPKQAILGHKKFSLLLFSLLLEGQKRYPKELVEQRFCRTSGELSGAICLNLTKPCFLGTAPELFKKSFCAVRAMSWLCIPFPPVKLGRALVGCNKRRYCMRLLKEGLRGAFLCIFARFCAFLYISVLFSPAKMAHRKARSYAISPLLIPPLRATEKRLPK